MIVKKKNRRDETPHPLYFIQENSKFYLVKSIITSTWSNVSNQFYLCFTLFNSIKAFSRSRYYTIFTGFKMPIPFLVVFIQERGKQRILIFFKTSSIIVSTLLLPAILILSFDRFLGCGVL